MSSEHEQPATSNNWEKRDTNFKALAWLGVLLFVIVILSSVSLWFLDRWFKTVQPAGDHPMSPLADMHKLPPEPRLQVNDGVDMVRMREETEAILTSYGWVDSAAGVVRLPIDRAIELTAQRGLPARQETK